MAIGPGDGELGFDEVLMGQIKRFGNSPDGLDFLKGGLVRRIGDGEQCTEKGFPLIGSGVGLESLGEPHEIKSLQDARSTQLDEQTSVTQRESPVCLKCRNHRFIFLVADLTVDPCDMGHEPGGQAEFFDLGLGQLDSRPAGS